MATRRSSFRALAQLAATAAALAACGCDASSMVEQLQETKLIFEVTAVPVKRPSPPAPPPPAPSLVSSVVIVAPPPPDLSGPPRLDLTERRFAGGRPIRWWSDRLGRLRRDGPRDLYDLTVARARLCGLTVEGLPDGTVAVTVPPSPTAAAAAAGPGARP